MRISEEADARDHADFEMEPRERGTVDLLQGGSAAFIQSIELSGSVARCTDGVAIH